MRGRFVTLEGIEGVGKSTQMSRARKHLAAAGLAVQTSREPGGTPLAEAIRDLVLSPGSDEPVPPLCELLLMFASRAAHVANRIEPWLADGRWVLCDRFTDATLAYQGGGRGVSAAQIRRLASWVHPRGWPDLTLLLDAPVDVALARRAARGAADRIELEERAFFETVRQAYLDIAAAEPHRVRVIDAAQPAADVGRAIERELDRLVAANT